MLYADIPAEWLAAVLAEAIAAGDDARLAILAFARGETPTEDYLDWAYRDWKGHGVPAAPCDQESAQEWIVEYYQEDSKPRITREGW